MKAIPKPDADAWGLPVWVRGPYEIVGDEGWDQFVVMRGAKVEQVFVSFEEADLFVKARRKEGR